MSTRWWVRRTSVRYSSSAALATSGSTVRVSTFMAHTSRWGSQAGLERGQLLAAALELLTDPRPDGPGSQQHREGGVREPLVLVELARANHHPGVFDEGVDHAEVLGPGPPAPEGKEGTEDAAPAPALLEG